MQHLLLDLLEILLGLALAGLLDAGGVEDGLLEAAVLGAGAGQRLVQVESALYEVADVVEDVARPIIIMPVLAQHDLLVPRVPFKQSLGVRGGDQGILHTGDEQRGAGALGHALEGTVGVDVEAGLLEDCLCHLPEDELD